MDPVSLHDVHTYTEVDRRFWEDHLEGWVPRRVIDAHVHVVDPIYQIETVTEEIKRSYWVMELLQMQTAAAAERCYHLLYPHREVSCLCFAFPSLGWEIDGANAYVQRETVARGWTSLAVTRPTWVAEQLTWWLDQPGVIGVKPYYAMFGYDPSGRDLFLESSIFAFLPHHQLEVLNERAAWITLHVPRAGRLGDPDNLREIAELRRRYPHVKLVIAHYGRCYTLPHAEEAFPAMADDPDIYFDTSAVLNPDVHTLALQTFGPRRILYGTDNPIFYLRGRREWRGRTYINHTSQPYHFNADREAPEVEATYTLYMYEALRAIKVACERCALGREEIEAIFAGNAERLGVRAEKTSQA